MCGRFSQSDSTEKIIDYFDVDESDGLYSPRYNVAPSQNAAAIFLAKNQKKVLQRMQWGWPPGYQRTALLINARSETIAEKKTFHKAFVERRCLIPVAGFYEWDKSKTPYFFMNANQEPLALAALWEVAPGNPSLLKFVVVTTAANGLMRPIHERMPVTLNRDLARMWLNANSSEADLHALCLPCPEEYLKCYPVSKRVNHADYESPDCITPCPGMFD